MLFLVCKPLRGGPRLELVERMNFVEIKSLPQVQIYVDAPLQENSSERDVGEGVKARVLPDKELHRLADQR